MPGTSPGAAKYAPASPMRDRPFPSLINRRRGDSSEYLASPAFPFVSKLYSCVSYSRCRAASTATSSFVEPASRRSERPALAKCRVTSSAWCVLDSQLTLNNQHCRVHAVSIADGWLARKKTGLDGAHQVTDSDNTADPGQPLSVDSDAEKSLEPALAPIRGVAANDVPLAAPFDNGLNGHSVLPISAPGPHQRMTVDQLPDPATTQWHYKDPTGNLQGLCCLVASTLHLSNFSAVFHKAHSPASRCKSGTDRITSPATSP